MLNCEHTDWLRAVVCTLPDLTAEQPASDVMTEQVGMYNYIHTYRSIVTAYIIHDEHNSDGLNCWYAGINLI